MPVSGKKLVLWMCTSLLAILLILDGALRVFQLHLMVAQFARFGYGTEALRMFGAAELLTGVMLLIPPVRLLGAGLVLFLMGLGVFAYVSTGVGFPAAPITIGVLNLALIWMHLEQRASPLR